MAFWGGFWTPQSRQATYELKRLLLNETREKTDVVVVGSSQAESEISTDVLEREFGPNFYAWILHIGGARGFDLLAMRPKYASPPPEMVICYLSEIEFYNSSDPVGRYQMFLDWNAIAEFLQLRGPIDDYYTGLVNGIFSSTIPLYHCRTVLRERILSAATVERIRSDRRSVDDRWNEAARAFKVDRASDF